MAFYEEGLPNIWGNAQIFPHIWGGRWSYMTLQLLHSEFPYTVNEENLIVFFISAAGVVVVVSYLEVLLGGLCAGPGVEGDEANWRGRLPVLAGHLEQRALVPLQNPPIKQSINQLTKPAKKGLRSLAVNEIAPPPHFHCRGICTSTTRKIL